jgi:NADPH2:quinone reductase
MRHITVESPGGDEQLQLVEEKIPDYGPDDVLIEMKAAGINYIDIYLRSGLYKVPHYPYTPGKEGSGIVAEIGKNVTQVKKGERVAFLAGSSGSYAEFAVVPANQVVAIPEEISFEVAAAAIFQGATAYYLSHYTFPLNQTHTALIHAGAGGVGSLLIQLAKLQNAKVISTVSSDEKAKLALQDGADEVVIYTRDSFLEAAMKFTNGVGVNVVYDSIGKTTFDHSLNSLCVRGMLVSYGQASGVIPPFEIARLNEKSLYLTRPSLQHYIRTREDLVTITSTLFNLIADGKLNILIGQVYSLADVQQAHADLESRKSVGKLVLAINL